MHTLTEKAAWDHTKELLEDRRASFGPYWTSTFLHDPKQLGTFLIRYKFAAKMACKDVDVLEIGCSEGIGAPILAEFATTYTGIDHAKSSVETAQNNLKSSKFTFVHDELEKTHGTFGAVITLHHPVSVQTIVSNLSENGICVVSMFNPSYEKQLRELFYHVFTVCDDSLVVACDRRGHGNR